MTFPPPAMTPSPLFTNSTLQNGVHPQHHDDMGDAIDTIVAHLEGLPWTPAVLYDANPAWGPYFNQEVIRVVGGGGAHPCQGTFTATMANPAITVEMLAGVFGGSMVNTMLVVGVRAGNDPTIPIAKPATGLGTPVAAAGVTEFQHIYLPAFGWEQVSASFMATVVFGKSRARTGVTTSALTIGTTYIWQLVQTMQAGSTLLSVGTNPITPGISPDNLIVWVPNSSSNTVTPVSLGAKPAWTIYGGMKDVNGAAMSYYPVAGTPIAVGTGPYQCRVSPNGAYVAVANNTAKTITIIDTATKTVVATSAALAVAPGIKSLAWSSNSTHVWVALPNGTIVPITAATGAVGTAVTVASGHNLYMTSVGGTTGWVLDLTTAQVFPLSGMTSAAVTVGSAIALASVGSNLTMSPADGSLWVYRLGNNSLAHITTAGVQSTTVLANSIASCSGMAITPDGSAIWLVDFNTAFLGFDCAGLQQSYYTSGAQVAGAYGVVLSNYDDIVLTLLNPANSLRVWPNGFITCGAGGDFPPNQGVSVIAQGVTVP